MGLEALLRGWVSRAQPQAETDNDPGIVRLARYGEIYTVGLVRKQHGEADEGTYFVANNAQTAITGQATSAYDATKPSLVIANTDSPANLNAKRIHIDYIYLTAGSTAYSNSTSNTGIFWGCAIDSGNRVSSGGTALTVVNPNMDVSQRASVAVVTAGAITTTTATASLRTVTGQRLMRLPVSGTVLSVATVDRFYFNFGGVESSTQDLQLLASATVEATPVSRWLCGPPIVIGPNQSFLFIINTVSNSGAVAGNFHYEVGWWER